ncbi:hypothetical protein BsWGS_09889 [Bradybaena similaris]
MEFITPIKIVVCSAGVAFNLTNIRVFLQQDWRTNNVTLALLSLSVSDLLVLLALIAVDILVILHTLSPTTVDYLGIMYYIVGWTMAMFFDISSLTTVLVSLERCLCIIMPLHVHSLFSVKRTVAFLLAMDILVVLSYIILFSTLTLQWAYDHSLNTTRLIVALSKERKQVEMGHNISNAIILPTFSELAVVINTVVMVIGLKRSSKFQKKASDQHNTSGSSKYKRLVIVVCCISCIFISCNTPLVIFIYSKHFIPGFTFTGVYRHWYLGGVQLLTLLYIMNASVNFFVYFFLNQRFRDKLREIVCGSSPETSSS